VGLSESLADANQRRELLVLALSDIVQQWQALTADAVAGAGAGLFGSPQMLLEGAFTSLGKKAPSADGTPGDFSLTGTAFQTLSELLSSARRVSCATLPDEIWNIGTSVYSGALVEQSLPFAAVWSALLPGLRAALRAIDGVADPTLRISLGGKPGVGAGSPEASAAFYLPNSAHVRKAAGLPPTDPSLQYSPADEG
jgi:hypothetical protein